MAATTPVVIPEAHRAGDKLEWTQSISDYLSGDGWTAYCKLSNATQDVGVLTSAPSGEAHAFAIASATTATWAAGTYQYVIYVEKAGERKTISDGSILIRPDLTTAGAFDDLGHVRRTLAAIETLIEGKVLKDRQSYSVDSRSLTSYSIPELIGLHSRYEQKLAQLKRAERLANGRGPGKSKVRIRFP